MVIDIIFILLLTLDNNNNISLDNQNNFGQSSKITLDNIIINFGQYIIYNGKLWTINFGQLIFFFVYTENKGLLCVQTCVQSLKFLNFFFVFVFCFFVIEN